MCANSLTHFSLFTGIGGIDLASEWAGFETIGQVELEEYQYNVLCKHWPDVPKWRDIRHVTKESLRSTTITDCTVLSGGFPCQPFSKAGKRRGTNDDRYLWPEMLRVLKLLNPRWLVAENVAGITTLEQPDCIASVENQKTVKRYYERILPNIIKDIEKTGYILPKLKDGTPIICNIPACSVGAPHRRERIFIIAHREDVANANYGRLFHGQTEKQPTKGRKQTLSEPKSSSEDVPNPSNIDVQREFSSVFDTKKRQEQDNRPPRPHHNGFRQWTTECRLGRVAPRLPTTVDRLKCLGNAVVPQQIYPIFEAIYNIETNS